MGLFVLVICIVAAAALLLLAKSKSGAGVVEGPWPFSARKPLSVPEQILYFRLSKSLPEHIVLAQVGLSRLLEVKQGHNFQAWRNRINRLSADFVVCSKDSTIVAVIELDDASHEREDRKITDAKKDKALTAAGIRIIRWQARSLPDEAAIKTAFYPEHAAPSAPPLAARL